MAARDRPAEWLRRVRVAEDPAASEPYRI